MHVHACDLLLLSFSLLCVTASRTTGRVHRDKSGDEEVFIPGVGVLKRAAKPAVHATQDLASMQHGRAQPFMSAMRMDRTGLRSRKFSGSIVIDASVENVWAVITDYNRLADIIPSLTRSRQLPSPEGIILVEQESPAPPLPGLDQRQIGISRLFERADLPIRTLESKLQESKMFEAGASKTTLKALSAGRTELVYTFEFTVRERQILFKGPQLLLLFEAQFQKELPEGLKAVKKAAENIR